LPAPGPGCTVPVTMRLLILVPVTSTRLTADAPPTFTEFVLVGDVEDGASSPPFVEDDNCDDSMVTGTPVYVNRSAVEVALVPSGVMTVIFTIVPGVSGK